MIKPNDPELNSSVCCKLVVEKYCASVGAPTTAKSSLTIVVVTRGDCAPTSEITTEKTIAIAHKNRVAKHKFMKFNCSLLGEYKSRAARGSVCNVLLSGDSTQHFLHGFVVVFGKFEPHFFHRHNVCVNFSKRDLFSNASICASFETPCTVFNQFIDSV